MNDIVSAVSVWLGGYTSYYIVALHNNSTKLEDGKIKQKGILFQNPLRQTCQGVVTSGSTLYIWGGNPSGH